MPVSVKVYFLVPPLGLVIGYTDTPCKGAVRPRLQASFVSQEPGSWLKIPKTAGVIGIICRNTSL